MHHYNRKYQDEQHEKKGSLENSHASRKDGFAHIRETDSSRVGSRSPAVRIAEYIGAFIFQSNSARFNVDRWQRRAAEAGSISGSGERSMTPSYI